MRQLLRRIQCIAAMMMLIGSAYADEINVAVAANFTEPAKALAAIFEKTTGHKAKLSFGATGAFYTQISHGAPFDVFLAADNKRPIRLEREGATVAGSRFTYAVGQLVLWSNQPGWVDDQGRILKSDRFHKLAIANPKNAPYGASAIEALDQLGLAATVQTKLVIGESIGQTYAYVSSGNADLGFVALSQVLKEGKLKGGSMWLVPKQLHHPIIQDAVILKRAQNNPAAKAWVQLLQSSQTKELIRSYGYATPSPFEPRAQPTPAK